MSKRKHVQYDTWQSRHLYKKNEYDTSQNQRLYNKTLYSITHFNQDMWTISNGTVWYLRTWTPVKGKEVQYNTCHRGNEYTENLTSITRDRIWHLYNHRCYSMRCFNLDTSTTKRGPVGYVFAWTLLYCNFAQHGLGPNVTPAPSKVEQYDKCKSGHVYNKHLYNITGAD